MVAADVLGFHPEAGMMSLLALATEIERGLPLETLDRVVDSVAPGDSSFAFRLVPRATLARRRRRIDHAPGPASPGPSSVAGSRLTSEEGARVARLAGIWASALDVWGTPEAAREFLFRGHAMLDGRTPVDVVLATELGTPLVDGILGRLRYGSAG